MKKLSSFFRQAFISFKGTYSFYSLSGFILLKVFLPLLQILLMIFTVSYALNSKDLGKYVIGNAIFLCSGSAIFGVSNIIRIERSFGTLSSIIVAPERTLLIILSKVIPYIFSSILNVTIGLLLGIICFNVDVSNVNLVSFFVSILITTFATTGLGFFVGSFGLLFTDVFMLDNLVSIIVYVFSGVNYDISQIPYGLGVISKILPMTRGIIACRLSFQENNLSKLSSLLFQEVIIGIIYFTIGYIMIKVMEKRSVKHGSLEFY